MMENVINSRLQSVRFAPVQKFRNISVLPLLAPDGAFEYRTLGVALASSDIAITEVSASGSVPELLVVNRGATHVLLLDGEELAGAKQNRVLNTSILLAPKSETRIPVSCTEQGRWSYASPAFAESGNVMAQKLRALKSRSVSQSLQTSASYHSDQGEVWHGIAELQSKAGHHSPTSAMHDVFKSREHDFRQCVESFPCLPGQVGLFVLIDGSPVGLDLVSLGGAYVQLHSKLVRSYALESLLESTNAQPSVTDPAERASEFLHRIGAVTEQRFPSVGCGLDCRHRGAGLAGSALLHENEVIHAAWFRLDPPGHAAPDPMASFLARRRRYTL